MKKKFEIGVVGNPNCGKTTIFNALTGAHQHVGNWPGVTVEHIVGDYEFENKEFKLVDLPGIYSLSTSSLDEEIAKEYILKQQPDLIVNIIDASNLERNLYLTIQLIEMRVPLLLVLNMMDKVRQKEIKLNVEKLSVLLGCPIVCTIANKKDREDKLCKAILNAAEEKRVSSANVYFSDELEKAIKNIMPFASLDERHESARRWTAIELLEASISKSFLSGDADENLLEKERTSVEKKLKRDIDIAIADSRYGFIKSVCKRVIDRSNIVRKTVTDIVDKFVLNRFLGIPIFVLAMYFTFWITINVGGCFIDFFDILFGAVFVDGFRGLLQSVGTPDVLITFLADGVGAGIQTIATFIPPIFFMFLCLSILEDSGYMARAAFVMDRLMRFIGLPGKAFVPMLVGFGCNVPAIMATRTLEEENDRIVSVVMNPFMSCGARMPVYALFVAAFFPRQGGAIVFSLYAIGVIAAVVTALLLRRTVFKGKTSAFIMELPPYHLPVLRNLFIHAWMRLKAFIFKAGKAILAAVVVLGFLNSWGIDGSFGKADSAESVLSHVGKKTVPVFRPLGVTDENWPAAVGLFTGIFAKEAVIGTLDTLYSQIDSLDRQHEDAQFDFLAVAREAFLSIIDNLSQLSMPFTLEGLIGADIEGAVEDLEVEERLYGSMTKRFDGRIGAYAYLLFVLLYMPCVAAIAAIYKEIGLKWTIFSCAYQTFVAWSVATVFYQLARFSLNPAYSIKIVLAIAVAITIFIILLRTSISKFLIKSK